MNHPPACLSTTDPISKFLTLPEFPLQPLGACSEFCKELSARYAVPTDLLALAMLSAAGGLVGVKSKMETTVGTAATPHLLAVCGADPGSNVAAALQSVFAPVRRLQEIQFEDFSKLDPALHAKMIRSMRQDRTSDVCGIPPPSGFTAADCDAQIIRLQIAECPQFLATALNREHLIAALQRSSPKTLLFLSNDGDREVRQLTQPEIDLDFLAQVLNSRQIQIMERGVPSLITPGLSAFLAATPAGTAQLLAHYDKLPPGVQNGLICFNSDAVPAKYGDSIFEPFKTKAVWVESVCNLMRDRYDGRDKLLESAEITLLVMSRLHNQLRDLPTAPPALQPLLQALPSIAFRLCAASFCLQTEPDIENTAKSAAEMARWFGGKMINSWVNARRQTVIVDTESAAEVMLARIQAKGPLTKRQLYRSYHDQSPGIHNPVIEQLLAESKITTDEKGRLMLNEPFIDVPAATALPLPLIESDIRVMESDSTQNLTAPMI